jgi:DNA-directed RNA polymerase subunit RPC12/RpoP
MVEIKCRTIPKPGERTRPVYKKNDLKTRPTDKDEPFIQGNLGEELDYICGNCGHLLAENVSQGEIAIDIVFECPNCQDNVEPRPIT